jgi:prepilin-type N-terminal cleavage/methylation domain-containing protein
MILSGVMKMYQPANNRVLPGSRTGFTVVELLIVVAILALAAVALVGVSNYIQTQGEIALTEQSIQLLSTAVAEFHEITGHYPVDAWADIGDTGSRLVGASAPDGDPNPDELLYLQLSLLPQTRKTISKLPGKLLAAPHDDITVTLGGQQTPYLRSIVDPWGERLLYEKGSGFPVIRSNGPDGESTTAADKLDDITNAD